MKTSDGDCHVGFLVAELEKPLSCCLQTFDGDLIELNGSYVVSREVIRRNDVQT